MKQPIPDNAPLEIERKFLIAMPDCRALEADPTCRRARIRQTYLRSEDGEERRVRMREEKGCVSYTQTVKTKVTDMTRIERECSLTREEYDALLSEADPERGPLEKIRYCLTYRSQLFEIDVYPFLTDRAILEIELKDERDPIDFPPFLRILREVTGDPDYKNSHLAKGQKAK